MTRTAVALKEQNYWMRADQAQPWYPWALLLLVLLLATFLWGILVTAPGIEADVAGRVDDRLHGAGISTRAIEPNGQFVAVRVSGTEMSEASVRAIAEEAQCMTWAGSLKCPSNVSIEVERLAARPVAEPTQAHPFTIYRDDRGITFSGDVPNREELERFVRWGEGVSAEVTNNLALTDARPTSLFQPSAKLAMNIVARLVQGQATWTGESLSVLGFATAADVRAAESLFAEAGQLGIQGDFDVRELRQALDCNQAFDELLTENRILFDTGSAAIQPSNAALLSEIASVVRSCPGELTVEGHTDNQGNADANKALSRERALAVRHALGQLGVDAERVVAVGYGAERPVADNLTATGRAKNRRITISVTSDERLEGSQ